MGFFLSKPQKPSPVREPERPKTVDQEDPVLARIRKTLNQDLETFLLNNIMLSVQFFDNFEREIGLLRENAVSEHVSRLPDLQRHCLSTQKLYESVANHVQFRPQHGEHSHYYELLHTPQRYVVHDNIEVIEAKDSPEYSSPCYRFNLENAQKNRAGYMKLQGDKSFLSQRRTTYETINSADDDEGIYTRISSDSPQEADNNRTVSDISEETQNFEIEDVPLNSQITTERAESVDSLSTNSNKSKKIFGPQRPELEINHKQPTLTPTERRLSDINKSSKCMNNNNTVLKKRKLHVLTPAQSLPNLPSTSISNPVKPSYSPKNSGDSSGYKSEGGSPNRKSLSPRRSQSSDSDYGYATITELTTPKPLHELRLGHIPNDTREFPKECFTFVDVPVFVEDNSSNYIGRRSLFETRCYLNSITFMQSFADIFSIKLASPLGFTTGLHSATLQGCKIYCDIVQKGQDSRPLKMRHQVTPTIFSASWPKDVQKWRTRPRTAIPDPQPGIVNSWPTISMMDQVQKLGCHLLPQGYRPTRGRNNEQHLEWQLAFPEAEQYLETCLTHTQIRCLLFSMAIYKTFLEPLNKHLGLEASHIRTLLFWRCEQNFNAWPQDQQGEIIRKFLEKLYEALMQKFLADYFIPKRNLFESTPRSHLFNLQRKLLHIRENLVMHLLTVVRNLRYVDTSFYPKLDYKKLYQIITTDNLIPFLNPNMQISKPVTVKTKQRKAGQVLVEEDFDEFSEEDDNSGTDLWKLDPSKDAKLQWRKELRTRIELERAAQKIANPTLPRPRRSSTESIDIKIHPPKGADPQRKIALLEFFIPHFIAIANKSNSFHATRQATFYLHHAECLTKLLQELEDNGSINPQSKKYLSEINEMRSLIQSNSNRTHTAEIQVSYKTYTAEMQVHSTLVQSTSTSNIQLQQEIRKSNDIQKQNGRVRIQDINQVVSVRDKMELPNQCQSILKRKERLQLPLPNVTSQTEITSAQVHQSNILPSSTEIVMQVSELSSSSPSLVVNEAVTAESTDF